MSYNIEKLNIQLYTNVKEIQPTPFTRSMLTNPDIQTLEELEEYPNFTYDLDFSELLLSFTYLEQIKFIFNQDEFYRRIETIPNNDEGYGAKKSAFFKKDEIEIVNKNIYKNLMALFTVLFPTYYPTEMNIVSSFDSLNGVVGYTFSIKDLIPFFLKSDVLSNQKNSIIEISGKKYTLSKTIWINDIFNHSEYKELPKKYYELTIYRNNEHKNMQSEIEIKVEKFLKDFETGGSYHINDENKEFFKEKSEEHSQVSNIGSTVNVSKNFLEIYEKISNIINKKEQNINIPVINKIETAYKNVESMISDEIKRILVELFRQKNDINSLKIIKDTYIDPTKFNLNYNNENDDIKNLLNSKYKKFTDFADEIKKFVSPKECTNGNLQQLLETVYSNPDKKSNEKFKNLMELYSNDNSKNDKAIQVGIVKNDESEQKYNIELQLELIGGEIDANKITSIECPYSSENIGSMLERLVKPSLYSWDIIKYRPFYFDSDSVEQPTQETSEKNSEQPTQQTGGNKTRKFKQKMLKTRKKRFYK
jgi:hypothetical protein